MMTKSNFNDEFDADICSNILEAQVELACAGIPIKTINPYVVGVLGPWTFQTNLRHGYWIANVEKINQGLPLDVATELNESLCGSSTSSKVVRVMGYAGGISPEKFAMPDLDAFMALHKSETVSEDCFIPIGEIRRRCLAGNYPSVGLYVPTYHIDTREGLVRFAETVRSIL